MDPAANAHGPRPVGGKQPDGGPSPRRRQSRGTPESGLPGAGEGQSGGTPVSVVVRCRPLLPGTADGGRVSMTAEAKSANRVVLTVDPGTAANNEPSYTREKGKPLELHTFRCNAFCDENTSQEEVFCHAAAVVDRAMEGYNGTIFCYGVTGSGKTYTMSGPAPQKGDQERLPSAKCLSHGIVQRAALRIFEYIRDRSDQGEVFSVEASFLEISSNDGITELLVDLLTDSKTDAKLEIRQDPLDKNAFVCEGLTTLRIGSPDELCDALEAGRRRCTFMETSRNCHSSRSHCLFFITVECLVDQQSSEPSVKRGKLVLVDLAGSESLKKVQAANGDDETLRRRQAIGINRVLTHLGTVVNDLNAGKGSGISYRNSALTMLLRDCLGGAARALLVANVGPELEWCGETFMTLTFAQKMMQVRNVEKQTFVDKSKSTLLQMRERHQEVIKLLKDGSAADVESKDNQEWQKLQREVKDLNARLLTKSNVGETLERLQADQKVKMDELRDEVAQTMATQLAKLQEQSLREFDELRQVIESKTREGGEIVERQWRAASEAQSKTLEAELSALTEREKTLASDVAQLRVQLGAAEQRVQLLQGLQQDFVRERAELDQEGRSLHQQADEQQRRLLNLDVEMNRYRTEASLLRDQVEESRTRRADDAAAAHAEREAWTAREAELKIALLSAREKVEAERSRLRDSVKEAVAAHAKMTDRLREQAMRLEAESGVQERQLDDLQREQAQLRTAAKEQQEREAALQQQLEDQRQSYEDEIERKHQSVEDLTKMLNEVQSMLNSRQK